MRSAAPRAFVAAVPFTPILAGPAPEDLSAQARASREPVRATEFWSIEYDTSGPVPKREGQRVTMMREEDARVAEDGRTRFMTGLQESLWLIRSGGR